jgi:thiamine phosphate synthase YjbQ (UPF0047 family)
MTYQQQISLSTKSHGDVHDLTEQVAAIASSSGIKTGLVNVFNVGSTAALVRLNSSQDCNVICRRFWTS